MKRSAEPTSVRGELGEYERKRDFGKTREPAPPKRGRKRRGAPRFVVQQHSARRLHWDLRLEHEGVAVSWAVPNGIPLDPDENRKAVHTEDHPLAYMTFSGEIPAGEYGGGEVEVWDHGTYEPEKWEERKIVFAFAGARLEGRYALFQAGRSAKDWMIHRIDPPARERDPFPEPLRPMLARRGELPARERGWAAELAWDGVRAIARCRPGRLELRDAELVEVTERWPEVRRLARALGAHDAVLDGELVVFDADGRPDPERLGRRDKPGSDSALRRRAKENPATYVIYDLLYLDGDDLSGETYERRRELLSGLELNGEAWRTPDYSTGHARKLLAASAGQGLDGLVLKKLSSAYAPGQRTGDWLAVGASAEDVKGGDAGTPAPGDSLVATAEPVSKTKAALAVEGRDLTVSNLGKVLYPKAGFTKGDLIDAYARLAEVVLPHLRGRPVTLKRYPDGVEGKHFYEKRCPKHRPDWLATARVWSDSHEGEIDFCLLEDLPSLVWSANLANIELHTSLARAEAMDRPTALVFDLDPGAPADVLDCAQVAIWIRGLFEQLGLECWVKTSGSKGLQIYAPLNGEETYQATRPFAKAVAETLERRFPERVVSRMTKSRRTGKVLIDWSQNVEHKTTACVYSLRAKERPTASTPVEWDEVESALAAADADRLVFTCAELIARVEEKADLFAPLLSVRQELPDLG